MSNGPLISVIIPVYKVELYLRKCVDSIIAQTYANLEIILVDDGSPDNCGKICDEYAEKDNRLKVIHKENEGASLARKNALEVSNGEYIQFIDSDDWVEKNMIELLYEKASKENLDILFFDFYDVGYNSMPFKMLNVNCMKKEDIIKDTIFGGITGFLWNKLIKKELLFKIDFQINSFIEDRFISLQLEYYAKKVGSIKNKLYHYSNNPSSLSISKELKEKRAIGVFDNYIKIVDFLKEKYGGNLNVFEPELSFMVNRAKYPFLFNSKLKKERKLSDLYQQANRKILSIDFLFLLLKKITLKMKLNRG